MYVEPDSAEIHAQMVEAFGLPTPTETEYEEAVGWYHVDCDTCYWMFNPKTNTWRVVTDDDSWHETKFINDAWTEEDNKEVSQRLKDLKFMAPDVTPVFSSRKS